jgi:hypothetical protein
VKKSGIAVLFASLILFPEFVQSQPAKWEPKGLPDALRIVSVKNGEEVEAAKEGRYGGWKLSQISIGPYFVDDLEMVPDPALPGQEIRFNLWLRNSGIPVRANIRIEDRDELVARLNDVSVEPGTREYQFPYTGYFLQGLDHCFTIMIEVEGKLYKAETTRELCIKPGGSRCCPN